MGEEDSAYIPQCHDQFGPLDRSHFLSRSCAMCYFYLFPQAPLAPSYIDMGSLVPRNEDYGVNMTNSKVYVADPDNHTEVCETLTSEQCQRWRACCRAAMTCCDHQLTLTADPTSGQCPRRWDGYSCWPDTEAGTKLYGDCPWFVEHSKDTERSVKICTENGTWFVTPEHLTEWTDYTPCLDRASHIIGVYINIGCILASIALLVPSIIILLAFRELRKQQRIRLHTHFFFALTSCALANAMWFLLVHRDMLVNELDSVTALYTNPVWCRVLSFSKMYLTSGTYMWMFCEGYYLHRLITKAFEPPTRLMPLYLLGWGLPLIPNVAYACIRAVFNNKGCWAVSFGHYQWIIDGPNLIVLLANLGFLCNIVRILLFQLHNHPHEPSNFRRGLKAVFMLIPLFGLQLILTIYRPPPDMPGHQYYEYFHFVVTSSQGFFVALIFCFCNGEVLSHLARVCGCCVKKQRKRCSIQMTETTVHEDYRTPSASVRTYIPPGSNTNSPKNKPLTPDMIEAEALVNNEATSGQNNNTMCSNNGTYTHNGRTL